MAEAAQGEKKLNYEWQPSVGWYRFLRGFFAVVFHTLWPLKVRGADNVPKEGAAVVVCNHLSLVDPFVVGYGAHRIVNFMAKEELFGIPILGFLIRKVGAFPVDRARRDAAAMRTALTVLKEGQLLGMFPEGTRSTSGEMLELHTGAARLAMRTHVPIVPAAVHNTNNALPPKRWIRPARIGVVFGSPFMLPEPTEGVTKDEALQQALTLMKERIEALAKG
jgi:1-acyl-sn-glycerol-3-phosphate acyltransferase